MRDSFESRTSKDRLVANQGVKLKPSIQQSRKIETKEAFEQRVQDVVDSKGSHLALAFVLGKRFVEIISDTRISSNIGPDTRSLEAENRSDIINYAMEVNADQNEQECMGSIGVLTLLLNVAVKLRDRINSNSYNYHKLEKRVVELETQLSSLSTKSDK